MRKSREEAAETRRRIVKTAAAEFRRHGIKGSGLAELMGAAGLTHGGFYRHFDSKEQLVAEATAAALQSFFGQVESWSAHDVSLETIFRNYLSCEHRNHLESGCPFAGLGSELARVDPATRQIATDGLLKLVDLLARKYDGLKPGAARSKALLAVSAMIGTLTLSRIVTDPELSDTLLRVGRKELLKE
jgi:TetR/AcrR family transcriptional regulator, transcriptional repressor for nem operon